MLHLVVGPSGAGKDTLIDAARRVRPDILFVRRCVTRPAGAGGEDHEPISPEAFEAQAAAGGFALWWRAHGLGYGVPRAIETALAQGRHVMANVSRGVVADARARFSPVRVLLIDAAPEALRARLAARGREPPGDAANRLARAGDEALRLEGAVRIDNGGPLGAATGAFLAALAPQQD